MHCLPHQKNQWEVCKVEYNDQQDYYRMFYVKLILNCDCGGQPWFTRQSGSNNSIIEKCIEHGMHRDIQGYLHSTLANNKQRWYQQIKRNRLVWLE